MAPKTCEVCKGAVSKYKCPTCFIPYCSLSCFKTHKGTPCSKLESSDVQISAPSPPINIERTCYVDEESEILKPSQLESIAIEKEGLPTISGLDGGQVISFLSAKAASSSEIREAVKDERLRKLIIDIDNSPDAENDLDKLMEQEDFRLFSEKILSLIST